MIMDSTPAEVSGTALALRGSARSSQVAGGSARYVLPRVPFRTKSLNLPLRLAAWRALTDVDRCSPADVSGKFEGIPVGEPYATVGAALAYRIRVGCSVNAVALG